MKTKAIFSVLFLSILYASKAGAYDGGIDSVIARAMKDMDINGKYAENAAKIEKAMERYNNDPRFLVIMGIAKYGEGDYTDAFGFFEKAMVSGLREEYFDLAKYGRDLIARDKDTFSALTRIDKMSQAGDSAPLAGEAAKLHLTLLNGLLKEKTFYPAFVIPHIFWLEKNGPPIPGLFALAGDVYYSAMLYGKAAEYYRKALDNDKDNEKISKVLAGSLAAKGDFEGAEKYYDMTVEIMEEKDPAGYSGEIKNIRNMEKSLPRRYDDISELIAEDDLAKAEQLCKERIYMNPGDYVAITQLARIYRKLGRNWTANRLFRKVLKMAPDYPIVYFYFGRAYFQERKDEKAFGYFRRFEKKMDILSKKDKNTISFYINALEYISYAYTTLKDYQSAMYECEKILRLDPGYQRGYFNLAVCFYQQNNRVSAYNALEKAIKINPDSRIGERAKFFIDYLRRNPDPRTLSDFSFVHDK